MNNRDFDYYWYLRLGMEVALAYIYTGHSDEARNFWMTEFEFPAPDHLKFWRELRAGTAEDGFFRALHVPLPEP